MPTLDIFHDNPAFSVVELTDAITVVPNRYGRLNELGLFSDRGVTTTSVAVEIKNGVLNLLPQTVRGGPASQGTQGKRKMKSFEIPQFAHEDYITAGEVQGIRSFGSTTDTMSVMDVVNDKMATMRSKHDITLEWLRCGALRGTVMDDTGAVILDLFSEFGVAQKEVDFVLGTDATDVEAKCREVSRHMEVNLLGDTMTSTYALCSSQFMDKLFAHPRVREAYQFQQGTTLLRNDLRKRFEYQGIVFEEYIGSATDKDGNVRKFIPDGDARFFPLGTFQSFRNYYAPADFMETVNTMGQRTYAKMAMDTEFQRWVKVHTQSNPLPICLRPALLVRGYTSN